MRLTDPGGIVYLPARQSTWLIFAAFGLFFILYGDYVRNRSLMCNGIFLMVTGRV